MINIKLNGHQDVVRAIKSLPNAFQHRIIGAANREAAQPLISRAQVLVRKKEGNLMESIGPVLKPQRMTKQVGIVWIGPRRQKGVHKGYHGHLIEFGHRVSRQPIKKGGKVLGFARPYPFMRPAFEQTKAQVLNNMKISLKKKLEAFVKRQSKKSMQ